MNCTLGGRGCSRWALPWRRRAGGGCEDALEADSGRSLRPIPNQTLALMDKIGTTPSAPVLIRTYKQEAELEIWKMKSDGQYALLEDLSDVPLVGPARAEDARGRPPGARGLLHHRPRPDEPELALLPVVQRRLSQRLRPRARPHRRRHHGARHLLVGRLLLDDRRADRRDLRDRARGLQRRSSARSRCSPIRSG